MPGLFTKAVTDESRTDQAQKDDIDFDQMRNEAEKCAIENYDAVQEAIKDTPPNESLEVITAPYVEGGKQFEEARKIYEDQPMVKEFHKFAMSEKGRKMGFFESVDDFNIPREQYVQNARNQAVTTFAVVKDGKWYERGEKDRS